MPNLLEKTWYGSAANPDQERMDLRRPLWLALAALGLVVLRYNLPMHPSDSLQMYERLAWALLHEQNWGKQALVGVLEYPPLPTTIMLLFAWLHQLAPDSMPDPGRLLVSICQVWTIIYLIRTARLLTPQLWGIGVVLVSFCLAIAGPWAALADPYWLLAALIVAVQFHVVRWERQKSLRDIVVVALLSGILVLGGIVGILAALAVILTLWLNGSGTLVRSRGGLTLLAMPFAYVLFLYPLFNWLILDSPFFAISRLLPWFSLTSLREGFSQGGLWRPCAAAGLVAIAAAGQRLPHIPTYTKAAWSTAAAAAIIAALRAGSGLSLGGEWILATLSLPPLITGIVLTRVGPDRSVWQLVLAAASSIAMIGGIVGLRLGSRVPEAFLTGNPSPETFSSFIDADLPGGAGWVNGRILVYNLRAAAVYSYVNPARFPGNLDFDLKDLSAIRQDEQFFLLLPPNDGTWYPPHDPIMRQLRLELDPLDTEVSQLLLIEKSWPNGWQLWRVVRDNTDLLVEPPPAPVQTGSVLGTDLVPLNQP